MDLQDSGFLNQMSLLLWRDFADVIKGPNWLTLKWKFYPGGPKLTYEPSGRRQENRNVPWLASIQFSHSVVCRTLCALCDPMDCSTPGFPGWLRSKQTPLPCMLWTMSEAAGSTASKEMASVLQQQRGKELNSANNIKVWWWIPFSSPTQAPQSLQMRI